MNLCILLLYCCHYYHIALLGDPTFVRSMTPSFVLRWDRALRQDVAYLPCAPPQGEGRSNPSTFSTVKRLFWTTICCQSRSTNIFLSWVSRGFQNSKFLRSSTVYPSFFRYSLGIKRVAINESPNAKRDIPGQARQPGVTTFKKRMNKYQGPLGVGRDWWGGSIYLPSGELTVCNGKIHHFSWENPL